MNTEKLLIVSAVFRLFNETEGKGGEFRGKCERKTSNTSGTTGLLLNER